MPNTFSTSLDEDIAGAFGCPQGKKILWVNPERRRIPRMSARYRRSVQLLLASASIVATLAMTTAVASAATNIPLWASGGTTLEYGVQDGVSGQSLAGLKLNYVVSGLPAQVNCATLSVTGKVENPGAGKPGRVIGATELASGLTGYFEGCQLVQYGKTIAEGLECTVPSKFPVSSQQGVLTNEKHPGDLQIATTTEYTVHCPSFNAPNKATFTGSGQDLWGSSGNWFFPNSTAVTMQAGGQGKVEYGIGLKDSKGPVTVNQKAYEEPYGSLGTKWYRGGAERRVTEGPLTLIAEGASTSLAGGAAALKFESIQSGVTMTVSCSGPVTGNVENPLGGGTGIANVNPGLTACAVTKPEGFGCKLTSPTISSNLLPGVVQAGTVKDPVLELNKMYVEIGSYTVTGCKVASLNHTYSLAGPLFAKPQMKTGAQVGSWNFPASLNKGNLLTFGQPTNLSGEITAENGGEVITMG